MDHDGAAKLDGDIVRFRVGANGVAMVQSGACMPANRSGKAILCRSVMPCLVPVKPIRKAYLATPSLELESRSATAPFAGA